MRCFAHHGWNVLFCLHRYAVTYASGQRFCWTHHASKQRVLWFSGRWMAQMAQKFSEVPTGAAVKRNLLDLYASNSLRLATFSTSQTTAHTILGQ